MEQYLSVKQLIDKLKENGIHTERANIFLKIRSGVLRPQAYKVMGKRKYPQYRKDYVEKLIASAIVQTRIDWDKVKTITDTELPPQTI